MYSTNKIKSNKTPIQVKNECNRNYSIIDNRNSKSVEFNNSPKEDKNKSNLNEKNTIQRVGLDEQPFEMIVEILKNLSPEEVAKKRLVSKAFNTVIENPLFMNIYKNVIYQKCGSSELGGLSKAFIEQDIRNGNVNGFLQKLDRAYKKTLG